MGRPVRIAKTVAPSFPIWAPEIVEVILPGHTVTARLEDSAEHVAHEGPAGIADGQGTGGIRRHELNIDSTRPPRRHAAPFGRRSQDPGEHPVQCLIRKVQVDEAGWRYVNGGNRRPRRVLGRLAAELRGDGPGDVERGATIGPGQLEGEVRSQVAVFGIGRPLDLDQERWVDFGRRRQ